MPSWAIHLNVAQKLSENMNKEDKQAFLLGNLLPDINVGYLINPISQKIPYTTTHYGKMLNLGNDTREFPDYESFLEEYKAIIKNPIILGYLTHLMTDFYWNYHTYTQKGILENGKLIGVKGKENSFIGDNEVIRQTKVHDFNAFSCYLYQNEIVKIPKFSDDLVTNVQPIKQIHIEKGDLEGVNQYFNQILSKVETEEKDYRIYSLEEMEKCSKENIEFIQKIFQKIE